MRRPGRGCIAAIASVAAVAGAACASSTPAPREAKDAERLALALRFTEAPPAEDGTPRTRVKLVRIRERTREQSTTELGTYRGACNHVRAREEVLLRAHCGWAHAHVWISVTRNDDVIVVHHRRAREKPLRELARFELPPGVAVETIKPATLPSIHGSGPSGPRLRQPPGP